MSRQVQFTTAFRRDYKREVKTDPNLDSLLTPVLTLLAEGLPLPRHNRDHALTGAWRPARECHLKPDLLLVYLLEGDDILRLQRLGSHTELGLG